MTDPSPSKAPGKIPLPVVLALLAAVILLAVCWLLPRGDEQPKPLYWVSQMDPNYRSSGSGKCPHGMDLVPVYAQDAAAQFGGGPGVVRIAPEVQQQLGVRTAQVVSGRLQQTLRVGGRVVADPNLMVKLSPRVTGWVDQLFVAAPGETVQRGQPLYGLYSPQLLAAQEQFLSRYRQRNAADLLQAETQLRDLGMDEAAIARLKSEGAAQRSVIFRAPLDGMVDMLMISEGAYVEPGKTLMAVGAMERVWAELEVFESQAGRLQPGQRVTLTTPAHPGLVWDTEIATLAPDLDARARTLKFRAPLDNRGMQLRPNMQLRGLVILPQRPLAPLVPRQAVIQLGHQDRVVLALDEGRFKSVAVTLGESNGEQVEVLSGLEPGEVVVISAQFLVDAESSKTSDFARMAPRPEPQYPPTWVTATVEEVFPQARKVRLQHQPIEDWKMPAMTMNFKVVEGLEMSRFPQGAELRVRLGDGDPLFEVLDVQAGERGETSGGNEP